jgi:hypothetical protein
LFTSNDRQARPTEILPHAKVEADVKKIPLTPPTGAMDLRSEFYVTRESDVIATCAAEQTGGVTMTIKGPRQMGKTSLLYRVTGAAERVGKRFVCLDFQMLDNAKHDAKLFYSHFCSMLTHKLGLPDRVKEWRKQEHTDSYYCTTYVKEYVLTEVGGPLLLAMDEVDRISGADFCDGFFGMLRSWHNERANDSAWKELDLTLITSIEPSQLIKNLNQSPFNVGEVIDLEDLTSDQVAELNRRYGSPFDSQNINDLMALLSGHPFLVHQAVWLVASGRLSPQELFKNAAVDNGPFGNHLRDHLDRIHTTRSLAEALRGVLNHSKCPNDAFARLRSMGVVRRRGRTIAPRCRLYEEFFKEHL